MENLILIFFVGMMIFGLYLLCTETVEDVRRDLDRNYKAAGGKTEAEIKRPLGYGLYNKGGK